MDVVNLSDQKHAILSAIIASTDDTIVSKSLDGVITSWNPAAERMFGYTEGEAVGKHISLIIPDDRQDEENYIIGEIKKGRKVDHFETVRRNKSGALIPISVTVSPIVSGNGVIIGASKIARDISEQKRSAERKSTLAAIVDTSDDAIVSKSLDGVITSWNRSASRIFGYTEAEAIGNHISLVIPPDRLQEEAYIISEVRTGNKVDHFQTFRRHKSGELVPVSISVSPITDDKGNIIGASKIARDISGEHAIQREKADLYEQLKELNAKKDEFIALASHELKTPLTSINGYLQILSQRVIDEKNKMFVQKMKQQVAKLSALVADLLDVSKIEAGKLQFLKEEFDLHEVIDDTIDLIAHANEGYSITLHTDVTKQLIYGDAHRIEQVMINLFTNAIRYSPGKHQIEVYLSKEAGHVKVGVQDHGVGIPEDKLNEVFSRFYRVEDTSKHASGLGLGLYLCYEIIMRHQGKIWVESKLNSGSTFWFTIPI